MIDLLEEILTKSELINLFAQKRKDNYMDSENPFVAYRVKPNIYKIRAFELWGSKKDLTFRIYHSNYINNRLKESLATIKGVIKNSSYFIDYKVDNCVDLAISIKNILHNPEIQKQCINSSSLATTSKFEGLELPDVDISENNVMGQTFTWREIISIWEDNSKDNNLKKALNKNGIYIQRSKDGKSRYIGSAYGENGIIGRWMHHLNSNGDARHLNLFILENGYNEIVFSVIEFYDKDDIIQRENMWKDILGTLNFGPYNGMQLNNN
ncbi:GIY-YIG nuclease family protein [Clostridium tarantellae]|uniref:GIY-YIG domain-containing protein n=1 Tax=Clostridium tarantellae TaxID=39493 RepID=A0A6I1MR84_9CLOT|nr:GIY-YIG nuclease family protein [Clostridium tarantellae]MPQ44978.1 hypothetical protein [Clostridium tarantellae]